MSRHDETPAREIWTSVAPGTERRLAGFLQVLELSAADRSAARCDIDRLRTGSLQAIVVHDVLSAGDTARIVDGLERHDPPFVQSSFPRPFRAGFYGINVNLAEPDLTTYFAQATDFNRQLSQLGADEERLPERLCRVLSTLDGGRPFIPAAGPRTDLTYMFMTIRAHREHGYIPAHFDNEVHLRPSYRHLAGQVQPHILSFVLTLDPGEAGGALEVFDLRCATEDARLLNDDHASEKPDLAALSSISFRLPPGSLILLDSGRYLHRVTPVQGSRTRWTACSFMSLARDSSTVHCWG